MNQCDFLKKIHWDAGTKMWLQMGGWQSWSTDSSSGRLFLHLCFCSRFLCLSLSLPLPLSPFISGEAGAKCRARPCYQQHTASVMETSVEQLLRHQIAVIRWAAAEPAEPKTQTTGRPSAGSCGRLPPVFFLLWRMSSQKGGWKEKKTPAGLVWAPGGQRMWHSPKQITGLGVVVF